MGLHQLALEKEPPQQPGVLTAFPLKQQLAPFDGMVISLSSTISVFFSPF
jgi:hypothetical protein